MMENLDKRTNDLSYEVIGAAIEVHKILGPGLLESVYEDALCIEFADRNIIFERQKEITIQYKGRPIGKGYVDILVDRCIVLELKAVDNLLPVHTAQIMTYLKITQLRLGLLINFNSHLLKKSIKRIIL